MVGDALLGLSRDTEFARRVSRLIHDGILVQVGGGEIVWSNPAACRLLRMSWEELAGRTSLSPEWQATRPDGRPFPGDEHPAMRVLATGKAQHDVIMGVTVGDGSTRWLSIDSTPWNVDGIHVAITVFTDVTSDFDRTDELSSVMRELEKTTNQQRWPTDERIEFAAGYRSVGPSRRIGGDFYGAYDFHDGRKGFFLGDVCGHGVKAAGLSSLARHTLQAIGPLLDDPNDVLARLHDVIMEQSPKSYLTAVYGYIRDLGDVHAVRFACGGHPRPILVSNGVASYVGGFGSIVGMIPNLARPVHELLMARGDMLVVYSDGLLSTPTPQLEESELLDLIPTDLEPMALVNEILRIASPDVADIGHDDTAVMVMRFE
ncbi:MAG: SpoIIE family protein phosphatase [Ilumatobacter sp.]|uniref:SpoIIE family protein phosphatase n=1 Tax=Ilumatobacter sp. TaxID=1967498 RepID=UPI00391C3138